MKKFTTSLMVVLAIVFSVTITSTSWSKTKTIKFMTKNLGDFPDVLDGIENGKDIEIYGKFTIPKKAPKEDKIPCMIYIHGSGGGFTKSAIGRIDPWLKMFHKMGVATFKLDSFKGRSVRTTVKKQLDVTTAEMVVDAYRALEVMAIGISLLSMAVNLHDHIIVGDSFHSMADSGIIEQINTRMRDLVSV